LYATMEDPNPSSAAKAYEQQVYDALVLVSANQLGSLVLDSLNDATTYWILPLDVIEKTACGNCGAFTFPGTPKQRGGERIYFTPREWHRDIKMRYSADDILFHELVHAYRDGEIGYAHTNSRHLNKEMLPDYPNMEEFLALQMQNTYLAFRRMSVFYHSYLRPQGISKEDAYKVFANDRGILATFRYFVENEPLASEVMELTLPDDAFNPWRDLDDLEKAYLKTHPGRRLVKL